MQPFECRCAARYHELTPQGRPHLPILLNWLQDAAGEHAQQLGLSVKELRTLGVTWVLSRLSVALERYPHGTEPLLLRTWPVSREGLFTIRDFELLDSSGKRIGAASSSWAVLNLKSRRPVRIDQYLPDYPLHPLRTLDDPFTTLPALERCDTALCLPVLRADLDLNNHVNNTVYARWALEAVPAELADHCVPCSIELSFRAEAFYGDTIRSCCAPSADDPQTLLHRIENATDGRELCRLRTVWKSA